MTASERQDYYTSLIRSTCNEDYIQELINEFDYEDIYHWEANDKGKELIIDLIKSKHIDLFNLGIFAIRETNYNEELFERAINAIRTPGHPGVSIFSTLILEKGTWKASYADLAVECLQSRDQISRADMIVALSVDTGNMQSDIYQYLNHNFAWTISSKNSEEILSTLSVLETTYLNKINSFGNTPDPFESEYTINADRVLRGILISSYLKIYDISYVMKMFPGEDYWIYQAIHEKRPHYNRKK